MDVIYMAVVFLTTLDTTTGLKCSKCTHVDFKGITSILNIGPIPKSPQCASTPPGQTANGVSVVQCPSNPTSGQVYKCVAYTGTVTARLPLLGSGNADLVYRDCVLMDPGVPATCTRQKNVPTENAILKNVLSVLAGINAIEFFGTRCVTSGSDAIRISDMTMALCIMTFVIGKFLNRF